MPWKKRQDKTYYYRSRRKGSRVVSEYLGNTPEAFCAADAHAAHILRLADGQIYNNLVALLDDYERRLDSFLTATLLVNGYYLHKRQWRKFRHNPNLLRVLPADSPLRHLSLAGLVAQTRLEKPTLVQLTALRLHLRADKQLPARLSDLATTIRQQLLTTLKLEPFEQASVVLHLERLSAELMAPNSTPLENLFVAHCLNAYLYHYAVEINYTAENGISATDNVMDRRLSLSQKRFFRALNSLAHLQRLALAAEPYKQAVPYFLSGDLVPQ